MRISGKDRPAYIIDTMYVYRYVYSKIIFEITVSNTYTYAPTRTRLPVVLLQIAPANARAAELIVYVFHWIII